MLQNIIVGHIGLAALGYAGRRIYNLLKKPGSCDCCSGCNGCTLKNAKK